MHENQRPPRFQKKDIGEFSEAQSKISLSEQQLKLLTVPVLKQYQQVTASQLAYEEVSTQKIPLPFIEAVLSLEKILSHSEIKKRPSQVLLYGELQANIDYCIACLRQIPHVHSDNLPIQHPPVAKDSPKDYRPKGKERTRKIQESFIERGFLVLSEAVTATEHDTILRRHKDLVTFDEKNKRAYITEENLISYRQQNLSSVDTGNLVPLRKHIIATYGNNKTLIRAIQHAAREGIVAGKKVGKYWIVQPDSVEKYIKGMYGDSKNTE